MKKIILLLLLITTTGFAGKGNYDEAKYRSDVLAQASTMLNWKYSNEKRMQIGYADCSSLVGRASHQAGMSGGVTGKSSSSWVTSTDGMKHMVKKIDYSQIKPGDILQFGKVPGKYGGFGHVGYVVENLGNGRFKMLHAGRPVKIVTIDVKTYRSGSYIGTITATDVLIANGYTPINSDGTVITPPIGAGVGTEDPAGSKISEAKTDSSLLVDWDEISNEFTDMINEGIEKMEPGLLILLSVLTVLEIMWVLYGFIVKNTVESVLLALTRILIRFGILSTILLNSLSIIETGYELFTGIGSYFLGTDNLSLNNIWNIAGREAGKILKIINESNFNMWNMIFDTALFYEELVKILLLFIMLILIYYFVVRILVEMLMAVIQFRLGLGLSWFFLPFDVNTITKIFVGNKVITVLFLAGTKIVVILALASIIFNNLEVANFGNTTFKELEVQTIFIYITVGIVMAFMMNKVNEITKILAKGS